MDPLFQEPNTLFFWKDIKTFLLRNQYNELLNFVIEEYYNNQYKDLEKYRPAFLNFNNCLTIRKFDEKCRCGSANIALNHSENGATSSLSKLKFDNAQRDFNIAASQLEIAEKNLDFGIKDFKLEIASKNDPALKEIKKKISEIDNLEENKQLENYKKLEEIQKLKEYKELEKAEANLNEKRQKLNIAEFEYKKPILDAQRVLENAKNELEIAKIIFKNDGSRSNEERLIKAQEAYNKALAATNANALSYADCQDKEKAVFCQPDFYYERVMSLDEIPPGQAIDLAFNTHGLTVGAVLWLYFYERMGIFKILGVLMDDYNYRGKFTISGSRKDSNGDPNTYSVLMDMICTLHRIGIGSNLRDRICTYQKVLGVSIENSLGIESERNTGFMQTFNKSMDYMLEYYKSKQLAQAIQSQNGITQPRSSVATQTSIRDTMNVLKQQFEPLQYGRNQINTFIGIATVHATLCLLNMVRTEIGIPTQYEKPEEFIPAAYDILVAKRKPTQSESNRFIVYDNCASYGYRLLTDIETADISQLTTIAVGSTLDTWLNDVEGLVEGYRNAYSLVPEKAEAMV